MSVRIEKIVYPGKSLARAEGKIILTDEGLPGELVEIAILKDKKNYIEARTTAILERSGARIEPRCAHYRACSSYQVIDYAVQIEIKKAQLEEILRHVLKDRAARGTVQVTPSPEIWGYRNKVRLRLIKKDDRTSLAYHQPASIDEFAEVDACYLIPEDMNNLLAAVCETAKSGPWDDVEDVEVKRSSASGEIMLVLHVKTGQTLAGIKVSLDDILSRFPVRGAIGLIATDKGTREMRISGRNAIEEKAGGAVFSVGPRSFFQVNAPLLETVIHDMKSFLSLSGRETVADLYCGIGTFGLALAPLAREVYGVESEAGNITQLKRNIRRNKAGNFSVCEGASEEWIEDLLGRGMDAVILDPPRRGLEPGLVEYLLEKPVPLIAYLSCNPTTLARDLSRLLGGYELSGLRAYDFFPHTPHIETLAMLHRSAR